MITLPVIGHHGSGYRISNTCWTDWERLVGRSRGFLRAGNSGKQVANTTTWCGGLLRNFCLSVMCVNIHLLPRCLIDRSTLLVSTWRKLRTFAPFDRASFSRSSQQNFVTLKRSRQRVRCRCSAPHRRSDNKRQKLMGLDQIGITPSDGHRRLANTGQSGNSPRLGMYLWQACQPFWFYAAWKARQCGIFAVCTLYTYAW